VRKTWGVKGKTPVVESPQRGRKRLNVIGAIALSPVRRLARGMSTVLDGPANGERCAEFLRSLLASIRGPVVVIWDNLAAHRAKEVKEVLGRHPRLRLERLPAYAPELNPEEGVWQHAKSCGLRGHLCFEAERLRDLAEDVLEGINTDRRLLAGFVRQTKLPIRVGGG